MWHPAWVTQSLTSSCFDINIAKLGEFTGRSSCFLSLRPGVQDVSCRPIHSCCRLLFLAIYTWDLSSIYHPAPLLVAFDLHSRISVFHPGRPTRGDPYYNVHLSRKELEDFRSPFLVDREVEYDQIGPRILGGLCAYGADCHQKEQRNAHAIRLIINSFCLTE